MGKFGSQVRHWVSGETFGSQVGHLGQSGETLEVGQKSWAGEITTTCIISIISIIVYKLIPRFFSGISYRLCWQENHWYVIFCHGKVKGVFVNLKKHGPSFTNHPLNTAR